MSKIKPSFFFLPDITGFANFVNRTEISHQEHIISELLNLLVYEEQLGLDLVEVEGDALFYLKQQEVPPADAFFEHLQRMFVKFHMHLQHYDKNRICQ